MTDRMINGPAGPVSALGFALVIAFGIASATPSLAQSYPEKGKTITFVSAFSAGGGTDTAARLVAPFIEKHLGIPVRVINKKGSGGQIGYTALSRSAPDGYTIGLTNLPTITMIYLNDKRKAAFKRESFQPLGMVNDEPAAVIVRGDSKYTTVKELMGALKANPNSVSAGSGGLNAFDHTFGQLLEKASGGKFRYVHFDSAKQAMVAMFGGHVESVPTSIGLIGSSAKEGKTRVLAVASRERSPLFPNTPTLMESGYDVLFSIARIVSMPSGGPKDVVEKLSAAVGKAIQDPEHIAKASAAGYTIVFRPPGEVEGIWKKVESSVKDIYSSR